MKRATFIFFLLVSKTFASTMKQDFLSPVTTDAKYVFWSGTAATALLIITEDSYSDPATVKTSEAKPLGDASKFGDLYGQLYPNAIYTLGMLGHGWLAENSETLGKGAHMLRATLYATLVTTVIKYTAREPRPDNIKEKNSFPSGHTTTAFAFATVVATEHEWYWGTLAVAGAFFTGYSRMNDGRHFLHDVVAGATIGASYGLGTYFTSQGQGKNWAFVPIIDQQTTGMRIVTQF